MGNGEGKDNEKMAKIKVRIVEVERVADQSGLT